MFDFFTVLCCNIFLRALKRLFRKTLLLQKAFKITYCSYDYQAKSKIIFSFSCLEQF